MDGQGTVGGGGTAGDVLRVGSGVGALVLVVTGAALALSGAGNGGDGVAVAAVGLPPLLWATSRPSWLSGIAASVAAAVTLPSSLVGIVVVPVVAAAALALCGRRARAALIGPVGGGPVGGGPVESGP